jgi:hypothetical protein
MPPQSLLHLIHRTLFVVVPGEELIVLREAPRVNGRERVFATRREIEISRHEQQRVANGFRIQPPPLCSGPKFIARIRCWFDIAGHLPGLREEQEPMHGFDRPTAVH